MSNWSDVFRISVFTSFVCSFSDAYRYAQNHYNNGQTKDTDLHINKYFLKAYFV